MTNEGLDVWQVESTGTWIAISKIVMDGNTKEEAIKNIIEILEKLLKQYKEKYDK